MNNACGRSAQHELAHIMMRYNLITTSSNHMNRLINHFMSYVFKIDDRSRVYTNNKFTIDCNSKVTYGLICDIYEINQLFTLHGEDIYKDVVHELFGKPKLFANYRTYKSTYNTLYDALIMVISKYTIGFYNFRELDYTNGLLISGLTLYSDIIGLFEKGGCLIMAYEEFSNLHCCMSNHNIKLTINSIKTNEFYRITKYNQKIKKCGLVVVDGLV